MHYKAVIFDLFETLVTEWGHKKYTKSEMSSDLGVEREKLDTYWDEKEEERYLGSMSLEDSILFICEKCGKSVDNSLLSAIANRRMKTKSACFDSEYVNPDVICLLKNLKKMGLKTAILSNCSPDEVSMLKESEIYKYFDEVMLSYEVHMKKPDYCIYEEAAKRLGTAMSECIFVGDGGSSELAGAKAVGMKAIQAKWYTNQLPYKRPDIDGFLTAEEPLEIIEYIQ